MNDKKLARVFHYDLYGKREEKYEVLKNGSINNVLWREIVLKDPHFYLFEKDFSNESSYTRFFSIPNLFIDYNSGVQTEFDALCVGEIKSQLINTLNSLIVDHPEDIIRKFNFPRENLNKIIKAQQDVKKSTTNIIDYNYRVFEKLKALYTGNSNGIMGRPRGRTMVHFLKPNIGLIVPKQVLSGFHHSFLTTSVCDANYLASAKKFGCGSVFPLYLYSKENEPLNPSRSRTPNLNPQIVQQLVGQLALTFTPEKESTPGTFAPIDILDYIYAILHSPTYRAKYKEFLKIDFPRVPYPKDQETFWQFVRLGGELRQIHLLESPVLERFITSYPVSGNNEVGKVRYEGEKVWINESQCFDHVPQVAWEFYIGGYQPAQKWLKDRKGRQLSFEDVRHYQKIIVALTETDRIMKEIDLVAFE